MPQLKDTRYKIQKNRRRGFTLIELMIAVSIVSILSTVGLVIYTQAQASARDGRRKQDISAIATALELYSQANGGYIGTDGESGYCIENNTTFQTQIAPFINKVPADPKLDDSSSSTRTCYFYRRETANSYSLYARLENAKNSPLTCTSGSGHGQLTSAIPNFNYCYAQP